MPAIPVYDVLKRKFRRFEHEVSGGLGHGCQPVGSSEFHKLGSTRFVACLVAKKLLHIFCFGVI
jgi:hypothetical protein